MVARPVEEFRGARERLVETLQQKGIRDLAVLRAIEMTPRHAFVPTGLRHRAYEDSALPIGSGQTISQPWVHARYLELLEAHGQGARARDRNRLGISDRAARAPRGAGLLDRAHSGADADGARCHPARGRPQRVAAAGRRNRRLARVCAVRRDSRRRGRAVGAAAARRAARRGGTIARAGGRSRRSRSSWSRSERAIRIETLEVAPVRFVPLVGSHGWSAGDGE